MLANLSESRFGLVLSFFQYSIRDAGGLAAGAVLLLLGYAFQYSIRDAVNPALSVVRTEAQSFNTLLEMRAVGL